MVVLPAGVCVDPRRSCHPRISWFGVSWISQSWQIMDYRPVLFCDQWRDGSSWEEGEEEEEEEERRRRGGGGGNFHCFLL